jgi:hypothetical protein
MRVQAALCSMQCGELGRAKTHGNKALETHNVLFGGRVKRFRRRYEREFQLALRPTLVGGPDNLWPIGEQEE